MLGPICISVTVSCSSVLGKTLALTWLFVPLPVYWKPPPEPALELEPELEVVPEPELEAVPEPELEEPELEEPVAILI